MADIFSDNGNSTTIDPAKDYAAELIGEGKRFKTAAELARSKLEADAFIEQLKRENAEMRSTIKGEEKLEALLDKLKAIQPAPAGNTNSQVNQTGESTANETATKSLSLDDVQRILDEREAKRREELNLHTVNQKVLEAFGANAQLVVAEKASSLGMTKEQMQTIAKTNPAAFLKLVEADKPPTTASAPRTSVNTAAFKDGNGNVKNNAYYQELRKKLGNAEFFKPEIQKEMFKAAKEMGDAFYN